MHAILWGFCEVFIFFFYTFNLLIFTIYDKKHHALGVSVYIFWKWHF